MSTGGPPAPHRLKRALAEVRAVYRKADALYEPFSCPASGECCQLAKTQRPPWLFRAEWLLLERHLQENGRRLPEARADGGCPFLDATGLRCSVYADRPLGCRTFFCGRRQGRGRDPLEEMSQLTRRLEEATRALYPEDADDADCEPRPLPQWFEEAQRGAR